MKEKIIWTGVVTVGFLIGRAFAEYIITEAHWPQYAKDVGLFLFQNPVAWTLAGSVGALIGWHVPEAFGEQKRGSEKIVELAGSHLAKLS